MPYDYQEAQRALDAVQDNINRLYVSDLLPSSAEYQRLVPETGQLIDKLVTVLTGRSEGK